MDRLSQLNITARWWERPMKGGRPTEKVKAEAATICDELGPCGGRPQTDQAVGAGCPEGKAGRYLRSDKRLRRRYLPVANGLR